MHGAKKYQKRCLGWLTTLNIRWKEEGKKQKTVKQSWQSWTLASAICWVLNMFEVDYCTVATLFHSTRGNKNFSIESMPPLWSVPTQHSHHPSCTFCHHCFPSVPHWRWHYIALLLLPFLHTLQLLPCTQCWKPHLHLLCTGRSTDRQQLRIKDIASLRVTFYLTDKKMHRGGCELYQQRDLSCQLWLSSKSSLIPTLLSTGSSSDLKNGIGVAQLFLNIKTYWSKTFAFALFIKVQNMECVYRHVPILHYF